MAPSHGKGARLEPCEVAHEVFFSRSADPLFLISVQPDDRFVLVAANEAHGRITGLPREKVLGTDPRDVLPPDVAELAVSRMRQCVAAGSEASYDDELDFPTGRRLWETRLVPLLGPDDEIDMLAGFARDVTDQRAAEAQLRESEARYRNLVETMHEGIWQLDAKDVTVFLNQRMAEMLGYAPNEMMGKPLAHFLDRDNAALAAARRPAHTQGAPVTIALDFLCKDGSSLPALITASPIIDKRGEYAGSIAAIQDLTAVRRAEAEQRQLDRRLQETQKLESLGLLAGGIAHDFNNILTGVLGSVSLARMHAATRGEIEVHLAHIETSAQRASELCRQMLAYAGKGRFMVRHIDLSEVVRETAELLRVSIDRTNVSLRFELDDRLPAIEADTTQLRQVLMNLVINAAEALSTPDWGKPGAITLATGSQEVDASYFDSTTRDTELAGGTYAFLEVADNGPGMSTEVVDRIFDPFFSTKFTGRGLGLSAVLGIVRGHRGAIKVYSEPGRGTSFKLLFPASDQRAERVVPSAAAAPPPHLQGTVLVVDDEAMVRDVISAILKDVGLSVVTAADGAEAVERVRERPDEFAAVLMDLTMPKMDGLEAFGQLRAVAPGIKMVLMSGYNEQDAISRFAGKGLAAFLQKPFTAQALQHKLDQVLNA